MSGAGAWNVVQRELKEEEARMPKSQLAEIAWCSSLYRGASNAGHFTAIGIPSSPADFPYSDTRCTCLRSWSPLAGSWSDWERYGWQQADGGEYSSAHERGGHRDDAGGCSTWLKPLSTEVVIEKQAVWSCNQRRLPSIAAARGSQPPNQELGGECDRFQFTGLILPSTSSCIPCSSWLSPLGSRPSTGHRSKQTAKLMLFVLGSFFSTVDTREASRSSAAGGAMLSWVDQAGRWLLDWEGQGYTTQYRARGTKWEI